MADDLNDEIKLSVDASGVETGINRVQRKIDDLDSTVKKVGKNGDGFKKIGEEAGKAGAEMDRATRNMVNSLQRQIAAAEAGGTATRAYQESIARLRGVNVDVLKPYLDQLDEAKKKTDEASTAVQGLTGAARSMGAVIGGIAIGLGAAFSLRTFIEETKAAEAEQAQLAAVLKSTGNSAGWSGDQLNRLADQMASITTFSAGEITQAQTRLLSYTGIVGTQFPKAMQAAANMAARMGMDLNSAAEQIGRALDVPSEGLSALTRQGFRFTEEQKKMAEQLEATGRAAEAQAIILEALDSSYGGAAAAARDTFGGALAGLKNTVDDLMTGDSGSITGLTSSVNRLSDTLGSPNTRAAFQSFLGWMAEVAASAVNGAVNLATFMSIVLGTDKIASNSRRSSDLQRQSRFLMKDYEEALELAKLDPGNLAYTKRAEELRAKLAAVSKEMSGVSDSLKTLTDPKIDAEKILPDMPVLSPAVRASTKANEGAAKSAKQAEDAYRALVSSIQEKITAEREELNQGEKLTESQRLSIKVDEQVASGKLKLTAARKTEIDALLKMLGALEREGQQRSQEAEATKQRVKAYESEVKAAENLLKQRQAATKTIEDSLQKARDEERAHILSAEAGITLAEAIERLSLARAEENYQKALAAGSDGETLLALQKEIEARKGLIEVMGSRGVREANAKAADEAAKKWEETSKLIGDTLADYIMGGGKDAASYLKRLFATLVLQPTVNYLASGVMGLLGMGGGGSGGSGVMGMASNGMSAYNLVSGGAGNMGAMSGYFGGTMSGANAAGSIYANVTGTGIDGLLATNAAYGTGGSGAAGGAMAGVGAAAAIVGAAALGWIISDYLDKGDSFSGAAYATSGGNDPYTQVTPGALNPNMDTGDLPDRAALLARLKELGASDSQTQGLNDRTLHRMMLLAEGELKSDRDGGAFMNWGEWGKNNAGLADFYRGQGYASPEQLGWFEQQDMGGREDHRAWDSFFQDPAVITASRQMAEGILAPIKSISDMLGNDDAYKVATGMAWNNKTGKITGGLQVWEGDESVLNWGSKEFENKDEYLRSTLSDSLGVLETMDGVPEWLKKQVDGAQEEIAKLEGENIGQRASEIFATAANSVAATFKQIETLIGIIPDLAGLSQDAVYSIGQAFGSLENYTGAYSGYIQNYYSEDERAKYVRGGINSSLAASGLSVDESTTREQYRALIEAQDLTTESGRAAYAALIMASDAFAQITPAAEEAAKALAFMDDLLKTRKDLEAEWLAVTGDLAGAERMRREQAIEGMKEEEIAQYDANVALEKRIEAEKELQATMIEAEKEFQATISGISGSLTSVLAEGLLGNLTGADLGGQMADAVIGGVYNALANSAAQQITDMMMTTIIDPLVRAALVGSLTAETVSEAAINNMVAHAKAVAEALGAVFNDPEFQSLMASLSTMFKDIAGSAPAQPYYSSYANQQKNAQKDIADSAARAAEQVKNAWEGVGDSLMDQVKRIRGDIADSGLESLSYWQSEFAIETAKARAGDVDAASGLSALSSSLLDAAAKSTETSLELQQMRAWVAQSLQDTAGYANAFAGGALTAKPNKTPTTVFNPISLLNQTPVVVSADPGLLAEVRELRRLVKEQGETLIKQGTEGNNMSRRREMFGTPVYTVPSPA